MISIVIPVYNVELFLPQCIDSLLCQSVSDFEVILVDDGSSDRSRIICDEYSTKDNRIKVIHQQNAGVSVARNHGIDEAKGEWITFIDSDDFVDSDYLASFEVDTDDSDLIVQGLKFYDHRNGECFKEIKLNKTKLSGVDLKEEVANNQLLSVGYPYGKLFRKTLLADNNIRFDTSISFHEDHIFVLQSFAAAKTIRLSDSTSYYYRCYHSNNTLSTKRHPWNHLNNASEGMLKCLDQMKNRFLEDNSSYCRSIYHFAYGSKIAAIYELFRSCSNYKQRKKHYSSIIQKKKLANLYHPTEAKNKILKIIMVYTPYPFIDCFIRIIIKYQAQKQINQ